jgi:uncharacterized protein YjeT (DUF2065 family)
MASEIELATGVVLFVFGLSFVLNPGYWGPAFKKMMTESQQTFVLFLVVLVLGILVVRGHNLWVADWRVLVTVTGWAALLKSVIVLLFPSLLASYAKWSERNLASWTRLGGALWSVGGAVVIYFSCR